jgi:hypothetical protein
MMRRTAPKIAVYLLLAVWAAGCDEGLGPNPLPTGSFSGLITYRNWPPLDSLHDLRLVAFKTYPPTDVFAEVAGGNAFVYPPIGDTALVPFFVDSLRYTATLPPGRYAYVAVAQQYGPSISTDWRAVGQYATDTSAVAPSPIEIVASDTLRDVNITVDFAHPPPQPF